MLPELVRHLGSVHPLLEPGSSLGKGLHTLGKLFAYTRQTAHGKLVPTKLSLPSVSSQALSKDFIKWHMANSCRQNGPKKVAS